jgi:hypothetical protein
MWPRLPAQLFGWGSMDCFGICGRVTSRGYSALQFWAQSFSAHSLFICNGLITALTRSRTLDKMISPCRLWVDGVDKVGDLREASVYSLWRLELARFLAASETSGDTDLSDQRSGLSLTQTIRLPFCAGHAICRTPACPSAFVPDHGRPRVRHAGSFGRSY